MLEARRACRADAAASGERAFEVDVARCLRKPITVEVERPVKVLSISVAHRPVDEETVNRARTRADQRCPYASAGVSRSSIIVSVVEFLTVIVVLNSPVSRGCGIDQPSR